LVPSSLGRTALAVSGVVQGVGFRPYVLRLAQRLGVAGWVRNAGDTVQIEVEGPESAVTTFVRTLPEELPPGAVVRSLREERVAPLGASGFHIEPSAAAASPTAAPIPPDAAPCDRCLSEITTPGARREGYAFTSCTACGPRYTIARGVPYDRGRTTFSGFILCAACRAEYEDPEDHRCHAQTIACPECGPRLVLIAARSPAPPALPRPTAGPPLATSSESAPLAKGPEALTLAARALQHGEILALKGVGGYQLLADARDEAAVAELRRRKHREEKPFAVLFASLDEALLRCDLTGDERRELTSQAAPIVLCATRAGSDLAPAVAMGSPLTGALLPASPLHHLLARAFGGPLVCTSGNPSSEPLCTDDAEAMDRLGTIADLFLSHDRPIARPCDDSVVRVMPSGTTVLRRARGFVPSSIPRPRGGPTVLALGGHMKSAVALAWGREVIVSQHIGDLDDAKSLALLRSTIDDLLVFTGARPEIVACDAHPDYGSTRVAEEIAARLGAALVRVQHHHAHIAAVMAEQGLSGPVLGFAWDGTGDGGDGTVWGGEALRCDGATSRRVAHLRPFSLPGGDRASREPRRAAAGLLAEIGQIDLAPCLDERERDTFARMISRGTHSPRTTSMGRLFDAIAALVGLRAVTSFEGQAAMELEHAAAGDLVDHPYPMSILGEAPPFVIDWEPLVVAVLADVKARAARSEIARRFHAALADAAVGVSRRLGLARIVLGGGCFQNTRLTAAVQMRLSGAGFEVITASRIPPNDGGLALGQAHVATERLFACHPDGEAQSRVLRSPPQGPERDGERS
jgi:hydrogenase maturation protein HypF